MQDRALTTHLNYTFHWSTLKGLPVRTPEAPVVYLWPPPIVSTKGLFDHFYWASLSVLLAFLPWTPQFVSYTLSDLLCESNRAPVSGLLQGLSWATLRDFFVLIP
jgi:hypothetical protein